MKLILTEEQNFLKDTAQSFARDKTPVTHFRELRDSENSQCWDESVWKEMVGARLVWNSCSRAIWWFRIWDGWYKCNHAGIRKPLHPLPYYQHPFLGSQP